MKKNCHLFILILGSLNSVLKAQPPSSFKAANELILKGSIAASTSSQRESIEKLSNDAITSMDFKESLNYWKGWLEKNPDNANLNYKVGMCYFFSYDEQLKALPYLKKALNSLSKTYDFANEKETNASPSTYYFLADTYLENNQPDSAIKYFSLYQDIYPSRPISTERGMSMSFNAKESSKNPRNVQVKNLGNAVNTNYAETNPVMRLDNKVLFFSSRRPGASETEATGKTFYNADIYFVLKNENDAWGNPIPFPFNTPNDEAPLYLSPNGDQLYFRKTVNGNTDIYRSDLVNDAWAKPTPLSEINTLFNETGLSISGDGKQLYYCSDQNKSAGKYDIFKTTKQESGKWGKPELLGASVNTPFNEVSPYISPDGSTLFFSSDGSSKKGMGSFDVYYSQLKTDKTWTEPASMGFPINKSRADINYYVASEDKRYYSSLTENNSYDIFLVEGGGFDFESIAAGTDVVTVTNEMGVTQVMETEKKVEKEVEVTQVLETVVEKEVEIAKAVEPEKEKEVPLAKDEDLLKENLDRKDVKVSDVNVENLTPEERAVLVEKVKSYLAEQLKSNESVKFKIVYFDFNKSNLNLLSLNELKLLVEFLGEHPETKIEIAGHGDNIGSWETNLQLSNKRAKEVYDFLITNKVSPNRMFFYGKGSAVPIALNDTEENRGKNRRVEVFILK